MFNYYFTCNNICIVLCKGVHSIPFQLPVQICLSLPLSFTPLQRIRATPDQAENKRLLMDYNVALRSVDCPYTIMFYGALFREVIKFITTALTQHSCC